MTFSVADQLWFARATGDWNPIHVDRIAARRELTGDAVVHGVHAVCWAVDVAAREIGRLASPARLKARFLVPIRLDRETEVAYAAHEDLRTDIRVEQRGRTVLDIEIDHCAESPIAMDNLPYPAAENSWRPPKEWSPSLLGDASGEMPLSIDLSELGSRYPMLQTSLGPRFLQDLVGLGTLVGMECPGLWSLFSEFMIERRSGSGAAGCLRYSVDRWDARFSSLSLHVAGDSSEAIVKTFVRPKAKRQLSYLEALQMCVGSRWQGRQVLIVGGSRGLGEVAAKLLAAEGARVFVTYHQGRGDAERVIGEIRAGGGTGDAIAADISDVAPLFDRLREDGNAPDVALVFATPPVSSESEKAFDQSQFEGFAKAYVEGFYRVWEGMRRCQPGPFVMFYPSTALLEELGRGFATYAAAKAAGETLCQYLQAIEPRGKIVVRRLPRLATDLSLSLIPSEAADPLPVICEVLLMMRAKLMAGSGEEES